MAGHLYTCLLRAILLVHGQLWEKRDLIQGGSFSLDTVKPYNSDVVICTRQDTLANECSHILGNPDSAAYPTIVLLHRC